MNSILHTRTSPYSLSTNGFSERYVRDISLRKNRKNIRPCKSRARDDIDTCSPWLPPPVTQPKELRTTKEHLDAENFERLKPVHGLIFLFKWFPGDEPSGSLVNDNRLDNIFFAKQVIKNACATQAIVSVLLNCSHEDVKLGESLQTFKEFSQSFDATMKGLTLSNSDIIKQAPDIRDGARQATKDDDVFHYVSYVPIDGRLYELDGLKEGPIDLGAIGPGRDWLEVARPVIERRMQRYNEGEIHFNLMAIVSDRRML
ncbi:UCHL5 [Cordylochernes scorpioides]|uniref:Ubiquitin carboxyl-terminal hydrolase n=1 Tax=Cordylochernes scorpioides TaxID=51811 RepID=A0ABY6LN32_9ARAC|nr:UCHL5 [Cordylochernes scorpioides]